LRKRQFLRQKLAKIAENCDHNIDPWSTFSTFRTMLGRFAADVLLSERLSTTCKQCCQMVYYQTQNPILGEFCMVFQWKMLVFCTAILSIFCQMVFLMDIRYILWSFGIFFPVLVCCTVKNLATLRASRGGLDFLHKKTPSRSPTGPKIGKNPNLSPVNFCCKTLTNFQTRHKGPKFKSLKPDF
jgi:hypothetical protein